jgi:uncharacterized protein YbcI
MTGAMNDGQRTGGVLVAISNALVTLHKEQFGRGPTRARTNFAGDDTLVCVLEDAMLPAERVMVQMGDQQRVRESRIALQAATSDQFVGAVERILSREVTAFASAIDPDRGVVWEVFNLRPGDARADGGGASLAAPEG